jgi:5'(3')-deoxyribonucleotidase
MIRHCLLDIDGVLADFVTDALRVHGKDGHAVTHWNFYEDFGMTLADFWPAIDAEGEAFWLNLKPYPWFDNLISIVSEYASFSLSTTPSPCSSCHSGKHLWIQKHFGGRFANYMMGADKHLMAKPGVVLIDDNEENVGKFIAHGGVAILFPQPWNRHRGIDPIQHVTDSLEALDNLG